jgi:hypothetical protein
MSAMPDPGDNSASQYRMPEIGIDLRSILFIMRALPKLRLPVEYPDNNLFQTDAVRRLTQTECSSQVIK